MDDTFHGGIAKRKAKGRRTPSSHAEKIPVFGYDKPLQ
jgi:hypothetical protein